MISVIICTRNRPKKLNECLNSILANSFSSFEIIVVDQSDVFTTKSIIETNSINYYKMNRKCKSEGLNIALKKASKDIIAFTDDDCIVDRNWLSNIEQSFLEYEGVAGIFGRILPYEPNKNRGKICPCNFQNKERRVIDKPTKHWKDIGFGNNMAFRRSVYHKIGGFKKWLGPGSVGRAAEDAEFALRNLLNGNKLLYEPNVIVYHNRWLTKEENKIQNLSYSCGEIACYGYYAFQGRSFAKRVVVDNFINSYRKIKVRIKNILLLNKDSLLLLYISLKELLFRLRGLLVAMYYSKKDPP